MFYICVICDCVCVLKYAIYLIWPRQFSFGPDSSHLAHVFLIWLIPWPEQKMSQRGPCAARFPLELIFGHKTFICQAIFKIGLENICMKAIHSAMVHVKHASRRCRKWSRCENPISLMCVCSVPPSNTRSHDVIITNI